MMAMRAITPCFLAIFLCVWSVLLIILGRYLLWSSFGDEVQTLSNVLTTRIDNFDARNLRQLDQMHASIKTVEAYIDNFDARNLRQPDQMHANSVEGQMMKLQQRLGTGDAERDSSQLITRAAVSNEAGIEKPLPVLVIACNRPQYTTQALDSLLKHRPSAERFPIIVSQDCGDVATADAIAKYGDKVTHIKQPDLSNIPVPPELRKMQNSRALQGYMRVARHYKWALSQVFEIMQHSHVIIVEDDLEVAPDFYSYFSSLRPLLDSDPSLWCVSAWNDNGKEGFINTEKYTLLYRTDFFPGLGWMLRRELWEEELKSKWPASYWDDWLREPEQRKNRACIRPEISRTKTFGEKGVSAGQFYRQHLQYIVLNRHPAEFSLLNLTTLTKDVYDNYFVHHVQGLATFPGLPVGGITPDEFQVHYTNNKDFERLAKQFQIMSDIRGGVPRTAYKGIVSFMYRGRRVHLTPSPEWTGYQS